MRISSFLRGGAAVVTAVAALSVSAAEYPIGKQHIEGGMEVGAVYLQPITMDPEGMMRKASDSDVHLEADIHAVKNNPTGFAEGDWMPYLQVKYELSKVGSNQSVQRDVVARRRGRSRSADVQARNERRQAESGAHRSTGGAAHQDRGAQHR